MTLSKETIEHWFREYYASLLSYDAKLMLPASKISGILGLSDSTVENHIYNAMKQLRSRL